ncbi:conserved hypothetical protein [Mesorhizobium sp. STM 4661]|nr:conserved hypothetical protein [Mesorhizobium sp. STM 4661]
MAFGQARDTVIQPATTTEREEDPFLLDCRAQLDLIINSIDFAATDREHRFFRYVVEETLAGRGDRIKAYSIAVEVFGRGEAFDPQSDPIVRIEAGHLRRALERYYLTSGQSDPIVINIPKGGYVPDFVRREQIPAAQSPVLQVPPKITEPERHWTVSPLLMPAMVLALFVAGASVFAWWWTSVRSSAPLTPRVLVEKFDDLTGTQNGAAIATGLKHEIISQLSKFKDVVVMETRVSDGDKSVSPPRFVLAGSVHLSADAFRLRVRLKNQADGSVLWANSYDGQMKVAELVKAQSDIASNVSTSLAQTYGVIFQADANVKVESPPEDWAAYSCSLSYYAYREDLDPEKRSSVRACLQAAVDRFPNYATGWGLLSLIYIDQYRYGFAADPAARAAALTRALAAARQATGLDPLNIRGRQAEMLALYFNREIEAALQVGKQALAINPNDTEFMSNYGERLSLSGKWTEGCSLIEEARQRNPGSSADYQADLGLCSYFSGDYSQAIMWISRTPSDKNPLYHLLRAAFYGEAGMKVEADRERAWLEQNQPDLVKDIRNQLSMRLGREKDVEFFIGSLRKAGLKIAD